MYFLRRKYTHIMNPQLTVVNPHLLQYKQEDFSVDVLGGVTAAQIHQLYVTLRLHYDSRPIYRSSVNLYNDDEVSRLARALCEHWEVRLSQVSTFLGKLTLQLEDYRFSLLGSGSKPAPVPFTPSDADRKAAIACLKRKTLRQQLAELLRAMGILGEDDNALILLLAMASHRYTHPFSVLCLAKSGIGKSYLLQQLAGCLPENSRSFHTQISSNALYYMDSKELQNKVLFIEDIEWTSEMLSSLATLQTTGRLIKTRATKDKEGMLHATTFEVNAKLCLLACGYAYKNYESLGLPFLTLHLNHSKDQDTAIMEYQKKCKAGLVAPATISDAQHRVKCMIACLEPITIINPYAMHIELPEGVTHPRKSLLLLLNFIEVVTFFFQHQRKKKVDTETGELYIESTISDIELAFGLLRSSLLRRADELSTVARGFYTWLTSFIERDKRSKFTALDLREEKQIHPRTLNRYLQELTLYGYIKIIGGNKHRGGYQYALTGLGDTTAVAQQIESCMSQTLEQIKGKTNTPNK